MAQEHLTSLGVEYYKEGQKIFAKLLLFGTLLLVSHALTIRPSEFDAAGIKIAVDDIVVVHGALAFIYLYYLFMLVSFGVEGSSYLPMNAMHRLMRGQLRGAKRPFKDSRLKRHRLRTTRETKRRARWTLGFYQAFVVPFALVFVVIALGATAVGVVDAYKFTEYLVTESEVYGALDEVLNNLA